MARIDLDQYLDRIGFHGTQEPTLETLNAVHLQHAQTIPFENLNPFLRIPVRLDIELLQEKLVRGRRGGWCFEHNLLLSAALKELGFDVDWLGCRVLFRQADDAQTARTHMALHVRIDGQSYLADVGFGGLSMTGPLRMAVDVEQSTPHGDYRLVNRDDFYILQASLPSGWMTLYRFDLNPQFLADYEIANWYLCNFPESFFRDGLIAARAGDGCRYTLLNTDFAIHHAGGNTERRKLADAGELTSVLEEIMCVRLPDIPELGDRLQKLFEQIQP